MTDELSSTDGGPNTWPGNSDSSRSHRWSPSNIIATHGLLILLIVFFVVFAALLPHTFPTAYNIRSILGNKSVTAFLALAVMIPLAANQFDLSVGFTLGLTHVMIIGLQINSHVSWELAILAGVAIGICVGLVNGVLVAFAQIDSFIATLAVGTFVFGITNWYTGGQQIAGSFANGFTSFADRTVLGYIPAPAVYVLACSVILWLILEYLPLGRRLYALGANPRAAKLVGIPSRKYIVGSFAASGFLTALGGVVLASQLQAGQSSLGAEYLLPAFVGALLGATTIHPGRVNVWGTLIAVLLLAVGISGLEQLGATFYVEPLFNGATLAVAVGVAGYAARRRLRGRRISSAKVTTRDRATQETREVRAKSMS